ncbi:MAG TPA: transposase [Pirellulales bacterium]|nr:transposase [Pirellulales bacterium]
METANLDVREQRGLRIAAMCRIEQKGGVYLVPSQSGKGRYTVCPDPSNPHCTCPDHETRGGKCKHIFAVEFLIKREKSPDGSEIVTNSVEIKERKTYPQVWRAYNAAQTNEKAKFQQLLADLCGTIDEPKREQPKGGRPFLPLGDAIFAATFKIYSTVSGRRFMTDLREAKEKGYISRVPHFNSIFNYLQNPEITPVLRDLIVMASLPLKEVETVFAADSTGFTTSRFIKWLDHRNGVERRQHEWVKVHIMCGVKTNVVTAVEIRDKDASDTKLLPDLVKTTAENFTMEEVCADKGYASIKNTNTVAAYGAVPYICFKAIHTGKGGGLWAKMYHYFKFKREEFLKHYHQRSNVESTFMMIKTKFRDHIRSKTDVAMVNEVLCKLLCHNICVLIQEMYELGIEPEFFHEKESEAPQTFSSDG